MVYKLSKHRLYLDAKGPLAWSKAQEEEWADYYGLKRRGEMAHERERDERAARRRRREEARERGTHLEALKAASDVARRGIDAFASAAAAAAAAVTSTDPVATVDALHTAPGVPAHGGSDAERRFTREEKRKSVHDEVGAEETDEKDDGSPPLRGWHMPYDFTVTDIMHVAYALVALPRAVVGRLGSGVRERETRFFSRVVARAKERTARGREGISFVRRGLFGEIFQHPGRLLEAFESARGSSSPLLAFARREARRSPRGVEVAQTRGGGVCV